MFGYISEKEAAANEHALRAMCLMLIVDTEYNDATNAALRKVVAQNEQYVKHRGPGERNSARAALAADWVAKCARRIFGKENRDESLTLLLFRLSGMAQNETS